GGHGLRRWLAKPFARRWFERLVGSVFLAFAVALLRFRPR
ncbi:TPA: LysE family translocator, partial [Stenotrophomonas maltophilia]